MDLVDNITKKNFIIPENALHVTITLNPKRYNYKTNKRRLVKRCMNDIKAILDDHCIQYHLILEFTNSIIPHYHGYVLCHEEKIYDSLIMKLDHIGRFELNEIRDKQKFIAYCTDEMQKTFNKLNVKYKNKIPHLYKEVIPIEIYNTQMISIVDYNMIGIQNEEIKQATYHNNLMNYITYIDRDIRDDGDMLSNFNMNCVI